MIYFTSDLHFNHGNILAYEPITRPFATIDEMNETLIANWNSVVKQEDTVYVLGDFAMGPAADVRGLVSRLNGTIKLVRGNHDTPAKLKIYQEMGIEIKDIEYLTYKGRFFILCHFPIASEEFMQMVVNDNSEVINVYGHVHSNAQKGFYKGTYHIGVDTNNLTPISIEQVWSESWPEEMMTPEVQEYKLAHEVNPKFEQSVVRGQRAAVGTFIENSINFDKNIEAALNYVAIPFNDTEKQILNAISQLPYASSSRQSE